MPKVTIARDWPDGERLRVTIETEPGHPDGLLSETERVAREAFAEACGVVLAAVEDEDEG